MKIVLCLLSMLVLLTGTPHAQEPLHLDRLRMFGFKGLNTADGDFVITPDYARVANNVDFSRYGVGTIAAAPGYDSASARSGVDSLLSLFGYTTADGKRWLAFTTDSTGVGYGSVYVTAAGSHNLATATRIQQYWPIEKVSYTTFNDMLVAVNGRSKGVVWDGTNSRVYPLIAPGEPYIVPLDGTSSANDNMTGEYRYAIGRGLLFDGGASRNIYTSSVSAPIRVQTGSVLLTNFSFPQPDSFKTTPDSCWLWLYRSKADPGPLGLHDTLWRIAHDTIRIYPATTSVVYIDTTSDASLSASEFVTILHDGIDVRDGASQDFHYGSPKFVGRPGPKVSDTTNSLYEGMPAQAEYLGVEYSVIYLDSALGIESDTSRSMFVPEPPGDSLLARIRVSIPNPPIGMTGTTRILYRAHRIQLGYNKDFVDTTGKFWFQTIRQYTKFMPDTVITGPFYRVAAIHPDSQYFTDSIHYDSLLLQPRYRSETPPLLETVSAHNNRLYGSYLNRLYESNLDSAAFRFGLFSFDTFGDADGDKITGFYHTRDNIMVKKHSTSWVLPPNGKPQLVATRGSIAPRSLVGGAGGHFYLSYEGVYFETDGLELERTYVQDFVSEKLSNFEGISMDARQQANAIWLPQQQKYLLSLDYTTAETTFVYDKRANAWSTWTGIAFSAGTLHDTGRTEYFAPPITFYFCKPGGNTLYRINDTTSESSSEYVTAPLLLMSDGGLQQVLRVGIWGEGNSSPMRPGPGGSAGASFNATVSILDHGGTALDSKSGVINSRYVEYEFSAKPSLINYIKIAGSLSGLNSLTDRIDVIYRRNAEGVGAQ